MIVVAAVALSVGTGGLTNAKLERGISGTIAESDSAYIALYDPGDPDAPQWAESTTEPPVDSEGETVTILYVHNQFETQELDVSVKSSNSDVISATDESTVGADETEPVTATVDCTGDSQEVALTVVATGQEISAKINFDVTVDCAPDQSTTEPDTATTETDSPSSD